ncbi:Regulating synaptic membrane exocytosis protein 2 [Takifugu flavidus]|uniref:Regulating synaptic membrane exocytosis protein 2 n=1 Tax=Takifugu flavidus TaxID=433684 RepID=A0A5C6PL59_9TELE|nr:Regulating synaptic membrane exocytosis protein 2 [Takifugu flavidus]
MSAPHGPRGGPGPGPAAAAASAAGAVPEMPDLSHLTEEERKIILGVMERQKTEEAKEQSMLNLLVPGGRHEGMEVLRFSIRTRPPLLALIIEEGLFHSGTSFDKN